MASGKIINIARNLAGRLTVTLEVEDIDLEDLQKLSLLERISIELKRFYEKRSLDANAYYWKLVGLLAKRQKQSTAYVHNKNLRDMRPMVLYYMGESPATMILEDTDEAELDAMENKTLHLSPTDQIHVNSAGKIFRYYHILKGSHEFDKREMTQLIDIVIAECQSEGIETKPRTELDALIEEWGKQYG